MTVYNIRKEKYANKLVASGVANRWNKGDEYIIYTGNSIALSTLELVAHRSAVNIGMGYKLLFIALEITDDDITTIRLEDLPVNWKSINSYPYLQQLGSDWYQNQTALILKVPSALVPWEHNYLINTQHPDFSKKVAIVAVENFEWDDRFL